MIDRHGKTLLARYDKFSVGPESGNYALNVTGYDSDSTLPDEMWHHNGMMFSTYDRDNDRWFGGNCARERKGGWWYSDCFYANPTGVFMSPCRFRDPTTLVPCKFTGIVWLATSTT